MWDVLPGQSLCDAQFVVLPTHHKFVASLDAERIAKSERNNESSILITLDSDFVAVSRFWHEPILSALSVAALGQIYT